MGNELTEALGTVSSAMTSSINIGTIAGIVGIVLTAGVGLYVGWFAIRKVINAVKGALKGKLKV